MNSMEYKGVKHSELEYKIYDKYDFKYKVSNYGDVYGWPNKKRKQSLVSGYVVMSCYKNGNPSSMLVHRLVAELFIPNPDNKPCVNHKNGIKHDNRVDNLEWVTYSENTQHAIRTGLQRDINSYIDIKTRKTKTTLLIDTQTGIYYNTILEASKAADVTDSFLCQALNGKRRNTTSIIKC